MGEHHRWICDTYCHSPSALTECLKQKLCHQWAKHLSRSLPAQVKQDVPLKRNINSDFTLAATTLKYLVRRGERNIPKRYLKEADWCEDGTLGAGYYIADPDNPMILILVDFNFKHLQWGCTHTKKDKFVLERPAPIRYRLCIYDEERTQDRSCWGPLDGTPDEDKVPDPQFKFGSEAGGDTPNPDIVIPRSQIPERRNQYHHTRPTHPFTHQQTTHPTSIIGWCNGTDCINNHPHQQPGGPNLGNWSIHKRKHHRHWRNPADHFPLTTQLRKWRWRWASWT